MFFMSFTQNTILPKWFTLMLALVFLLIGGLSIYMGLALKNPVVPNFVKYTMGAFSIAMGFFIIKKYILIISKK